MGRLIDEEDLINLYDEDDELWWGNALEFIQDLPTVEAIPIPKGATNGDMIKALFPEIKFNDMAYTVHATTDVTSNGVKGGISYDFWKYWWNAPYGGGEK